MTTTTEDEPKRKRPTVAAITELTLERDTERRARDQARQELAALRTKFDQTAGELADERAKWTAFDPEALALGRLVIPLAEYAATINDGRWSLSDAEALKLDEQVARAVERLLISIGARFGAQLIAARIVESQA